MIKISFSQMAYPLNRRNDANIVAVASAVTGGKRSLWIFVLLACFAGITPSLLADVGGDNPVGTSGQFNGNVTTGCSVDPLTMNATRSVTDLVIAGGVGSYPLAFTRTMNSRYTVGVGNLPMFGAAGSWSHSYQWTIDAVKVSSGLPTKYNVNYPDGRRITFSNRGTGDSDFRGPSGVRDRFVQLQSGGTECHVRLPDGGKVWFHANKTTVSGGFQYTFSLTQIIDPYGQTTTVTYPSDGSMTITEPAGRTIKIFYTAGPVGDTVVNYVLGSDGRRVDYTYTAFNASGTYYTSLTRVRYFGNATWDATYTYQLSNITSTGRPLIATCTDPMFDGPMWKIAYDFKPAGTNADGSTVVYGQVWHEKHPNGTLVSTLTINPIPASGWSSRTETRGDNPTGAGSPTRTFKYHGYRLQNTTDFKGVLGSQTYDSNNYLASVIDRNGNTTSYTTNPTTGMVNEVDYPATPGDTLPGTPQTVLKYGYDDPNNPYYLNKITNGYVNINTYDRDTNHQVTKITYPDTNVEKFTYNSFGQQLTHTLRDSSVETWQYNDPAHPGAVSSYWDAAHPTTGAPTTQYQYDPYGRVWKTTEARGYTTIFEYNARGQLTKLTHPDGTYVQNAYNPNGTLASTTDELVHTTSYTYDDYKRVRTVITATSHTTTTFYDQARSGEDYTHTDAKPTKVLSPLGKSVNTYYDENLRVVRVQRAPGTVDEANTYYAYDANGNRTTVTDPNGKVTTTYYDKQNRVKFVDDPMVNDPVAPHKNSDGHTLSIIYDTGGHKVQERRVDSKICKYTYNKMGRLKTKSGYALDTTPDPFPDIITYQYDALGNMTDMMDPLGHHYSYTYDGLKRKLTATYPKDVSDTLHTETFHYDVANHLDSYVNPASQTETLVYDSRGRLTNTSWSANAPTVATAYDAASRPTSITTSDGTTIAYGYDNANIKIYEDQTISGLPTRRVQTDPDADSNRTDLLVTTGSTTNFAVYYDYTNRSQLLNIYDNSHSAFFKYTYDGAGNVSQRLGQRLQDTTAMQYDPLNRPTLASQTGLSGSALETMNYEYTKRGNLRDQYFGGGTVGDSFSYDDRDQLINVLYSATGVSGSNPNPQNPAKTVSYDCGAIDRNGMTVTDSSGTTSTTYTKDNLNQYTQINNQSLSYDSNFNLTAYAGWSYSYDAMNRMVAVGGNGTAAFLYDGTGRCVKRVINGATTIFTYDGWRSVAEWDGSGNLVATNVYGVGIDEPLYTSNASGQFYYKQDALGNVRFLLNASGTMIEQYTYDAFGTPTIKNGSGTVISASAMNNRFMFKGREYLAPLGLYDHRKRMYHPALGKFLQVDPVGFAGDPLNLFRFCNHNPMTRNDPMGEDDYADSAYIDDFGFNDPFFDPFPAFFDDQGALDTPIPDINLNTPPIGGSPGQSSGTSLAQGGNMSQSTTVNNVQSGSGGVAASGSAAVGTGSNTSAFREVRALIVVYPDGSNMPMMTNVKNDTQAQILGVPKDTPVPIFVPTDQTPEATLALFRTADPTDVFGFNRFWSDPDNDYKSKGPDSAIYDAYGNFMYGATGTAMGLPEQVLQGAADMKHGGSNDPINRQDIQSGIDAIKSGGVIITRPVIIPWNGGQ